MKTLRSGTGVLLLLILAMAQWAGIAYAQTGDGKTESVTAAATYDYVADATDEWTTQFGEADGSGDWRVFHNDLYGADHQKKVGWADGYCIETVPGERSYCTWSLYADTWTLSAHGLKDEKAGDNQYAIAGGTGDYNDVHGYLHVSSNQVPSNEVQSQTYFTLEKQDYSSFHPLHVIADAKNWKTTYFSDPASSYGNVLYWHEPAYSDDEETVLIGSSDGYCIWTAPNQAAECMWTVSGVGWSVSAAGRKFDVGKSTLTITSGTGEYAGATGTVTRETSPDGARSWLLYNFGYLPTTLHKSYEAYIEGTGLLYGDVPPKGDAKGDVYYWHSPLLNREKTTKIGWSDGFCVITAPKSDSACLLTLYTDHWTITASGPRHETNSPTLMAVTGGSGAYADVSGTITIKSASEGNSDYEVAMDLTFAPTTYWAAVGWDQVTEDEIPAWYTLGWNEDNWDGSHPAAIPDSESRRWEELTPFEQAAATAAGFDASSWDASSVRKPEGDPDGYWRQYDWDALYLSEQRLWGILGWDASNWSGIPEAAMPTSNWRPWAELKPVEEGAASQLGYDEKSWDARLVRTPVGDVEEFWSQFEWEELSEGERQLFALLGWNAESWAGDQPVPESNYQTWGQLSAVEKGASKQLGYGEETWDATELKH